MRDLPPFVVANRQDESRTITFIRDSSAAVNHHQRWTTATSAQNQVQIPFFLLNLVDMKHPTTELFGFVI